MISKFIKHGLHALLVFSAALLAAAPALAANPIDDSNAFVRQHYLDFLQRPADSGGEAFWAGEITQCGGDASCVARKRVDVARAFFFSSEFIDVEQSRDGVRRLDDSLRNTAGYNEAFVDAAYRRYWRIQRPSWDTYVNLLNAGIPNADYNTVIQSFITDERYRGRFSNTPHSRSLDANRNRLFADWAARNGQSGNLCQAWAAQSCSAKGSFLTLTHRLQVSLLPDNTTPLDHMNSCYAILGDGLDGNHCGGDDNRLFLSMDAYLKNAMNIAYNNPSSFVTRDQNNNNYWKKSADGFGPHAPFDASDETSYGHPRGQVHFWKNGSGNSTPVNNIGVYNVVDPNILEIDQDYDVWHPSSTECGYDTDGCDTCKAAGDRAYFSSGPGRMIYARQHPYLAGSFAGPDYEWAPTGCERQWCGGCGTCEAKTSWGYQLGRPATSCGDVPCDGTQDYVCTLDGGTKVCTPPYGWLSGPPPVCDANDEQACYNNGNSWDPITCSCTYVQQCQPDGYCSEYDYNNCTCLRN
jgi:hypothetical protein